MDIGDIKGVYGVMGHLYFVCRIYYNITFSLDVFTKEGLHFV